MTVTSQGRYLFFAGLTVIYVCAWVLQDRLFLNWDVSWLLRLSKLALAGKTYTNDYFDPNPPVILFLYSLPVLFSKCLGLKIIYPFRIYIFLLASMSLFICHFFIKTLFAKDNFLGCLLLLTLAALFLLEPMFLFGQRECLLLIFTMPYVFLVAAKLHRNTIKPAYAIAIGLFAGLGFAIKPQFLSVFCLIEITVMVYSKNIWAWRRPETFAVIILYLLLAAVSYVLFPDYFLVVVPYVLATFYSNTSEPLAQLIAYRPAVFCYLAIIYYFLSYKANSYKVLSTVLVSALTGLLIAYFSQQTLSIYHILPAFSLAILLWMLLLTQTISQPRLQFADFIQLVFILTCFYFMENSHPYVFFQLAVYNSFLAILFALLIYRTQRSSGLFKILVGVELLILGNLIFSYFLYGVFWSPYHLIPTAFLLAVLFGLFVSKSAKNLTGQVMTAFVAIMIFGYPVAYAESLYLMGASYKQDVLENLIAFMQTQPSTQSLYVFSTAGNYGAPLVDYVDAQLTQRYANIWMAADLVKRGEKNGAADVRQYIKSNNAPDFFLNKITEDFYLHKPDLVFVDTSAHNTFVNGKFIHFDYLNMFMQNQRFLDEWRHYVYLTTLAGEGGSFGPYQLQVYKRI
jgi:hypothetical protein